MITCVSDPAVTLRLFGPGLCVDMNTCDEVNNKERIYTFGLGGCVCTLAFRGDRVQLAHFDPTVLSLHLHYLHSFKPEHVMLWVPGDWVRKDGGRWELQPKQHAKGYDAFPLQVLGYDLNMTPDDPSMVDFNAGKITAFRMPVERSS